MIERTVTSLTWGWLRGVDRSTMLYGVDPGTKMQPLPMSFWVVQDGGSCQLIDVGATPDWADAKGVTDYVSPADLLREIGIEPFDVSRIYLTHLHWDHASAIGSFPRSELVVQRDELRGWQSMLAASDALSWVHRDRVGENYVESISRSDHLRIVVGNAEVEPGIRAISAPGHTMGTQALAVDCARTVVVASDVVFLLENLERGIPLGNGLDQVQMLLSMEEVVAAAGAAGLIVPGHDPEFLRKHSVDERVAVFK